MRPALLLALLAACGQRPGAFTCEAAPFVVTADYAPNCETVRADVALARDVLDARGIVSAAEFDSVFAGVPVVIRDLTALADNGTDGTDGRYGPAGIELSYNASALLHECLHHLDSVRLDPLTHWHTGWEGRGWLAADDEYVRRQQSPSFGPSGPLTVPRQP